MPITVAGALRLTTHNRALPGAMKTAITAPGPVSVAATGSVDGGSVPLEASVAANRIGYWGYSIKPSCGVNEQPTLGNGAIVEGFAGVTPGGLVYIADDGTLTHTRAAGDTNLGAIGVGVRAAAIHFFAR